MKYLSNCLASLFLATGALVAHAAGEFPTKPVTIVVPYSAGGPIDSFMRAMADKLGARWKQPVIIDNRPGANEIIGATFAAKAPSDGYTIFAPTEASLLLNPLLYKKLPYDPDRQFTPVTLLAQSPLIFTVPANSPASSMQKFIELARGHAAEPLTYGTAGVGGPTHLPFASLERDQQVKLVHVPYRGGAPVMQALLAGEINAGVIGGSMIEPYVKSGRLKGLAVSSDVRLVSLPEIPTFKELGIKDIQAKFVFGFVAPKGTPADIVSKIANDATAVLRDPDFKSKNVDPFALVPIGSTPSEFADYLKKERPIQQKRVSDSGVQLEF